MVTTIKYYVLSILAVLVLTSSQVNTPSFEGEIVYANTFKSKIPRLKEDQLAVMLGAVHNFLIKGGDYKTVTNGMFAEWQLYINKENRLYNKMASSDTVFWNDAGVHYDKVLSSKINKNVVKILGYMCDELILVCESGTQKFYYSSKLPVDSKLYVKNKYGNFYNYMSIINAVPLKMIVEEADFSIESVATKVIPRKLEAKSFLLPAGTKTAKSLY